MQIPPLRRVFRRDVLWPVLVAAVIILASSRSRVASPHVTHVDDKIVHFSVYGLLATLVCRLSSGWKAALAALLTVSAFGVTDEWHQSFVPGRSTEVADWVADTSGAALAIVLYMGWTRYRQWLEKPLWRVTRGMQKTDTLPARP
jgi:VanZ family protein